MTTTAPPMLPLDMHSVKWDQPVSGIQFPNERCIELPLAWECARLLERGRVLDAGCGLNLDFPPPVADLTHLTQSLESEAQFAQWNRWYVDGDLRHLTQFADGAFDRVVCVSTLEHVGRDNSGYGGPVETCPETMRQAAAEIWRVCKDQLLITVPFHHYATWNAQWGYVTPDTLPTILPAAVDVAVRFYHLAHDGWRGPFPIWTEMTGDLTKPKQIAVIRARR